MCAVSFTMRSHAMPALRSLSFVVFVVSLSPAFAADVPKKSAPLLPIVRQVELQPLKAQVKRVAQALELLGNPLSEKQQATLQEALDAPQSSSALPKIQEV